MQKLQDSVFSIVKTSSLSPAVFSYLQPSEDSPDKTPLGGILSDTKHGWLALGPKFCVVDLRTGLKVAAHTFGAALSNFRTTVTCVVELPTPLTTNSQQLLVSLECEDIAGMICVFHINGSQILRCIKTEVVVTELSVCDGLPDGPFTCFDGIIMAGSKSGEVFVFDLNRAALIQALKDTLQGYEQRIRREENAANLIFLPSSAIEGIETERDLALENDDHIAILLNESSFVDGQYIFRNPDGTVRMKAKRNHIRVTVVQYIPQLGSLAVGYNFGAFQIWNLLNLDLEFTSQVNLECLPVTHFGFQEPCDDPRAFCYLWVVFSVIDRFDEEEFPLAVLYSLTYQGKRMLSDTKFLYQEFLTATIRFQVELSTTEEDSQLVGGRCVSCHTYSINSSIGEEGEDNMLNLCQLVWECWGERANSLAQHGMLLFDLDQWYKDQMPATYQLQSNAFMSATWSADLARGACATLDVRLAPASLAAYAAPARLEEHFYPNSLHYDCVCLNTSESCVLSTIGIQRQIVNSLEEVGPTALLNPTRLYNACVSAGLVPLYLDPSRTSDQEEQRRYLLSVALEGRLSRFLKRCAHDWATGSHAGVGCTLPFLVDWCWKRAIELKENARELTTPLFTSSALPDRNVVRCLEHCVQQLTQLTGLLDAVLTKCCNLVMPEALSEIEEKYKGIGTVSLYFQVVQWFLRCGLLPERSDADAALPYPQAHLDSIYNKRRLKLHRLQDHSLGDEKAAKTSCSLLYIDQLIEQEFGGDRIHQMWIRGGSDSHGLYPPPSLYSLLRLYLLPDIAEEHKHSLVLYLLVDYSMVYDEVRYEAVIRRLMQFPTMFGLSNTAIKATQAFWHLDHRDFDFALDQLQCLTGNTLSEWQHNVVLSSLLAQKKTQAALQYLHVRKPAPIQCKEDLNSSNHRMNDHDKLEDWQACCNLYLARGLVFEALDVIRMCVQNAGSVDDKAHVLNFFFKGCRNTGHLSKVLQVTLLPFEEEMFIKYLENCNESQTSDILIMYYLQQARYLEAEQYNNKIKLSKPGAKEITGSVESMADVLDREAAKDTLIEVVCSYLPPIANVVARCAIEKEFEPRIKAPKPMSVFVQAKSPQNKFTYKSSFIQDTIENASETWINKPKMRKGLKRALNIEETPFICTPKLMRAKSIFTNDQTSESTPPKRARLDLTGTPRTPKPGGAKPNPRLSRQMETLLNMPEIQSPDAKMYSRSGAGTPHSILKIRNEAMSRDASSPVDSRYLGESDDELLETASNHTHYSDSTNKHLRFTIPTASESGSTPSPVPGTTSACNLTEMEESSFRPREKERDTSVDTFVTTQSHAMSDPHPLESPPKRQATEENIKSRKSFKDSVRARRSLSISANSSLSDDPNTSIESIADIPITLINPRYSGEKRHSVLSSTETTHTDTLREEKGQIEESIVDKSNVIEPPKPRGRRGIKSNSESTPVMNRSRSATPERQDSPVISSLRRNTKSWTSEISPRSSPLNPIPEQPKQEIESEPHPVKTTLSLTRQLRSRTRTPERIEKVIESPKLEAITESPTKADSLISSPTRRSLRSRSRTPEVEVIGVEPPASPRSLRSRSKTPEKIMSPKRDHSKSAKKSLSRIVLEANTFAKTKQTLEKLEMELNNEEETESAIECTPMKALKQVPSLMDVTISPIISKSILQSSNDSLLTESETKETQSVDDSITDLGLKSLPAFTMNETRFGKSVLHSFESNTSETGSEVNETKPNERVSKVDMKSLPAFTLSGSMFEKSVLHSYQSSVAEASSLQVDESIKESRIELKLSPGTTSFNITDIDKSVLGSCDNSEVETKDKRSDDCKLLKLSSVMTSDSDIEMKEQWEEKRETRDTAAIIQKEKETIVEIEREIHEIEGDMSEDEGDSDGNMEVTDSDEDDESSESENDSSNESDQSEEVISINDTDSESDSSNSHQLQINEESSNKEIQTVPVDKQEKTVEVNVEREADTKDAEDSGGDPLNQGQLSIMTDDNSARESDKSDVNLNYSDEAKPEVDSVNVKETISEIDATSAEDHAVDIEVTVEVAVPEELNPKDSTEPEGEKVIKMTSSPPSVETNVIPKIVVTETEKKIENIQSKSIEQDVKARSIEKTGEEKSVKQDLSSKSIERENENKSEQEDKAKAKSPEKESLTKAVEQESKAESTDKAASITVEEIKPATRSKKRAGSTTSNKSTKETEEILEEEPKTPVTRKRSQSIASNKSTEATPTAKDTPSRRRAKTPSSTEVRKIITRRASKEISERMDDSQISVLEESLQTTPKRRSSKSRSVVDDNASVASSNSVRSTRSKVSEDGGDVKQVRKGRKSVLPTKPDLSVIPELAVEDGSKMEDAEDIIKEYSSSRKLTRHQKSMLESWLEPKPAPRRASTASRASAASEHSLDDDASSTHSGAFDVQPIDRISLLNKADFEGSPDLSEAQSTFSPESIASDASKQRRSRLTRAASESKSTPKAAKVTRRVSVDVDIAAGASPVRGRRASFNRACEALHTPKGRRTSTDVRKGETDSQQNSPAASEADVSDTPSRQPRRASTHSNTSQTKTDISKRSKKTAVEESKDTKKK